MGERACEKRCEMGDVGETRGWAGGYEVREWVER